MTCVFAMSGTCFRFLLDTVSGCFYTVDVAKNIPTEDDPVRIGATLKALREAYGWQLGKFALTFNPPLSHGHLANIEAGRKRLSPERARQAAKTLGVPLAAIMTGRDVDEIAS